MTSVFAIGIPILLNVILLAFLKLRGLHSLILICVLGIFSTFAFEFTYCDILKKQCEPDALEFVGYMFHSLYVITGSSIIYIFIYAKSKKSVGQHGD